MRLSDALKRGRSDETPVERERRENWELLDIVEASEENQDMVENDSHYSIWT